jgi:hypothetical protein
MSVPWPVGLTVCLAASVAIAPLRAQVPTLHVLTPSAVPPPVRAFKHHHKLQATYDSVADSTHLGVVTHKGKYFVTIERPRLTWSVAYPGRAPGTVPPDEIELEFRTQEPQAASNSQLVITYGVGQRVEIASAGAYGVQGVQTWNHFMRFPIPCGVLAEALANEPFHLSVGGIAVAFKPDQAEALRDLLSRVGAE